jgi:ferric-dicitrate binding protein FerR (iron transport regulator)
MNYVYFELSDFLEDSWFKNWVYKPTRESDAFWAEFLEAHPEKTETVSNARSILTLLAEDFESQFPQQDVVENMWGNIMDRKSEIKLENKKSYRVWFSALSAVAAAFLVAIGWNYKPESKLTPVTYHARVSNSKVELTETKNSTNAPVLVTLPDKSTILLHPCSSVSYPENFNKKKNREVYLSGQGFFKVTKNPERPFIVYANEVVTKVLGTSFLIKAFEHAPNVEVEVRTGKVSVFAVHPDSQMDEDFPSASAIIVTPNQKILYSRTRESIRKYLVEAPEMIASDFAAPPILNFEDAKVSDIFSNLEKSYEIEIIYDKEKLGSCLLTASFTNESIYDKIDLICKGIEAEFKVEDGKILISGRGCH